MEKNDTCKYLKDLHTCGLGYWNGKTTNRQCGICKLLKRDSIEVAERIKFNPKDAWKMNSYSPQELYEALENQQKIKGFGDIIYKFAQPIAKTVDKTLGTKIQNCGGCKKRRELLNKLLPID
jgi:hypothetical protein